MASDERSGKGTLNFFFFIPDNGYCIRKLEYLLVQTQQSCAVVPISLFYSRGNGGSEEPEMVIITVYSSEHLPSARHGALHSVSHLLFSTALGDHCS